MWPALNSSRAWIAAASLAAVLTGCGKKEEAPPPHTFVMPEVNDANCKSEAIVAMAAPLEIRQRFGSLCARRIKPEVPSKPKSYTF